MTKPTKEQIDQATPEQLAEWVAAWCMGHYTSMNFEGEKQFIEMLNERNGHIVIFEPHLPTDKGKAQAVELAKKYKLQLDMYLERVAYVDTQYHQTVWISFFDDKIWQTAVLKACLYSVIGE